MHRSGLLAIVVGGALVAVAWPARAQRFDLPDIPQCTELVPGAISVDETPVSVNLRVVLDGVSRQQAETALGATRVPYAPLNVGLQVSYDTAGFSSSDGAVLIDQAKQHYGGRRPAGVHAVYVLTSKDLYLVDETGQQDSTLVGLADCIGGVAYPEHAFAVGEALPDDPFAVVYAFGRNLAGKVLGHELGHLLGAHHHYANCAESLPETGDAPCTLMINDVGLASLDFSSTNALVTRGHAQGLEPLPPAASAGGGGAGAVRGLLLLLLLACARHWIPAYAGPVQFEPGHRHLRKALRVTSLREVICRGR